MGTLFRAIRSASGAVNAPRTCVERALIGEPGTQHALTRHGGHDWAGEDVGSRTLRIKPVRGVRIEMAPGDQLRQPIPPFLDR